MTNNKNGILIKRIGLGISILVIFATVIISYVSTSADVKYNSREILKVEGRSLENNNRIVENEKKMIDIYGRLKSIDNALERIEGLLKKGE